MHEFVGGARHSADIQPKHLLRKGPQRQGKLCRTSDAASFLYSKSWRPAQEASCFPQGCSLFSIPTQLRSASRLQHLRIGADGTVLRIERADLETLSAMPRLTFLSIAQVPASTE